MGRLSRVAAAINLRTSDPLTESGHDPVADLRHYYGDVAGGITLSWTVRGPFGARARCSGPRRRVQWPAPARALGSGAGCSLQTRRARARAPPPTPTQQEALARQARPTAETLGLTMDPFTDGMADLDTLALRLEYAGAMMQGVRVRVRRAAAPARPRSGRRCSLAGRAGRRPPGLTPAPAARAHPAPGR